MCICVCLSACGCAYLFRCTENWPVDNLPAITNSEKEQQGFGFYINIIHVKQFGTILNQHLKNA